MMSTKVYVLGDPARREGGGCRERHGGGCTATKVEVRVVVNMVKWHTSKYQDSFLPDD
jgi:hypothetical protein